jgi:hypothetical protein
MPRKRTPSPEIVEQDKQILAGMTQVLRALSKRYGSDMLNYTANILDDLAANTATPKPRTRKPKAQHEAQPVPERRPFNPTSTEARAPMSPV